MLRLFGHGFKAASAVAVLKRTSLITITLWLWRTLHQKMSDRTAWLTTIVSGMIHNSLERIFDQEALNAKMAISDLIIRFKMSRRKKSHHQRPLQDPNSTLRWARHSKVSKKAIFAPTQLMLSAFPDFVAFLDFDVLLRYSHYVVSKKLFVFKTR